jgi:hypothetical protein
MNKRLTLSAQEGETKILLIDWGPACGSLVNVYFKKYITV